MTKESASPIVRIALAAAAVLAIFAVLLGLDLTHQGVAWHLFWSLTGEELPLPQIRGMVEWFGNLTRLPPDTAPLTPISNTGVNPYGVNTFLQQEVEPAKREQQVQMISEAGFHWIRQEFPWEDIEISGRGDFVDQRNDLNGDGQPDAVDAWAKYDNIVDLADQYGLQIEARLSNPPGWSQAGPDVGDFAPPVDLQDYVNFATAVATRYKGRIHVYQVWNEPNIFPEWGNQSVDPETYTTLLCRTYQALKTVDPTIQVMSGALAPTVSLTGRDLNDYIFLQRMYDAGLHGCFDIMSVQGYGFYSGPTDHRMRPTTETFAHNLYIRDLMVANGDADKPIWISEAAWNPVKEADVPPDITGRQNYGEVTEEQAARYMPLAYQRAQEEWPWVGVVNYWFFKLPETSRSGESWYYFRMINPDFTSQPVYDSMRQYIASATPTLNLGVHQADDWAISLSARNDRLEAEGAEFGDAAQTDQASFTASGTDVIVRWQGTGALIVIMDENTPGERGWEYAPSDQDHFPLLPNIVPDLSAPGAHAISLFAFPTDNVTMDSAGWHQMRLPQSLLPENHHIRLLGFGGEPFLLDSVTVLNRPLENVLPLAAGVVIGIGMLVGVVVSAWRARSK